MSRYQIQSIVASLCFFLFYYGGMKAFHFIENIKSGGMFLFFWFIGAILILFVFYHWVSSIRIIWKRFGDPYRGIKLFGLIVFSIVASWLYPFIFPDEF